MGNDILRRFNDMATAAFAEYKAAESAFTQARKAAEQNPLARARTLQEQLKAEIESLQDEVKLYMQETGQDEIITDDGIKCTWRQTISNRFMTTEFKKQFAELYKSFTKPTAYKRFTLNH